MRYLRDRMNVQLDQATAADKRNSILESTIKLIRQYGFHGTSMSQIAQAAQVATGTIYHYFESKEDLMLAVFVHCDALVHQSIFHEDDNAAPYPQRLESIWVKLVSFYMAHPDVLSFLEQFFSSPYVNLRMRDETVCGQDKMGAFLKEGIRTGHIKDVHEAVVSSVFLGAAVAVAKQTNSGTFVFNEKHLANTLTILWEGIKI